MAMDDLMPGAVKPITPKEVDKNEGKKSLPPQVLQVFNELIQENYRKGRASFKFKQAAARIADALGITEQEVYDRNLLDVEEVYRKAGWRVTEDKPGWDETYDGYWVFQKATRG